MRDVESDLGAWLVGHGNGRQPRGGVDLNDHPSCPNKVWFAGRAGPVTTFVLDAPVPRVLAARGGLATDRLVLVGIRVSYGSMALITLLIVFTHAARALAAVAVPVELTAHTGWRPHTFPAMCAVR